MVRQFARHIECGLGGQCVLKRPRATQRDGQRHPRDIDDRHQVAALRRKQGALARGVLRGAVFPRAVYRQTWERLATARLEREACKSMVGLPELAVDGPEARLADELEQWVALHQLPDLPALTPLLTAPTNEALDGVVEWPSLAAYDGSTEVAP